MTLLSMHKSTSQKEHETFEAPPAVKEEVPGAGIAEESMKLIQSVGEMGASLFRQYYDMPYGPQSWRNQEGRTNEQIVEWTNKNIGKCPRLLQVKGTDHGISISEVERRRDCLNEGDVFILDASETIYEWYGKNSNAFERKTANAFVKKLIKSRGTTTHAVVLEQDGGDDCPGFWKHIRRYPSHLSDFKPKDLFKAAIGGGFQIQKAEVGGSDEDVVQFQKKLYPMKLLKNGTVYREGEHLATRFLENHGMKTKKRTKANPEDDNKFDRALLDSSKAYLLDDGKTLWVWIGLYTHIQEEDALVKATQYLEHKSHHGWGKTTHNRPISLPILLIREGKEPREFLRDNFYYVKHTGNAAYYEDDYI